MSNMEKIIKNETVEDVLLAFTLIQHVKVLIECM
ncbi:Uncharacterised protein [Yersinia intermedia]|jgi:hypothetical protein|nr:Uncharacterised protein [Yersinia intermedia]CRF10932.1 Uncharacterised protein [Yersinia intermedia]